MLRGTKHRTNTAAAIAEGRRFALYAVHRRQMEALWDLVSKPIKFPAPSRRRRGDRELPKAA